MSGLRSPASRRSGLTRSCSSNAARSIRACPASSSWSRRRGGRCRARSRSASRRLGELGFLVDPIGPGTTAIARLEPGDEIAVFGPLGNGFRLDVAKPLLVGGGIGVAPFPYLSEALEHPPAILGFRSAEHAEAAALVPNAEVVIDPVLVTDAMPSGRDVLACGPEPMLEAVRALAPDAQLAWEAPMACGYGACYGCVVEIDGALKRLCRRRAGALLLLNASGCLDALTAPEVARALDAFVTKTVTPEPRDGNPPVADRGDAVGDAERDRARQPRP